MKKKISMLIITLVVVTFVAPSFVLAGPEIQQVRANVENLWKPLKANLPSVTARDFKKIMDSGEKFVLVDVRSESEYKAAHLPGAVNISRGVLEWVAPGKITNTDAKIYVYCRTGARSSFATKRLTEMGYTNVVNISDSFEGWVKGGYPVYNRHGKFVLVSGGFEAKE